MYVLFGKKIEVIKDNEVRHVYRKEWIKYNDGSLRGGGTRQPSERGGEDRKIKQDTVRNTK
jgi:hypothetical protein